mgnify:CR=1 FL=1
MLKRKKHKIKITYKLPDNREMSVEYDKYNNAVVTRDLIEDVLEEIIELRDIKAKYEQLFSFPEAQYEGIKFEKIEEALGYRLYGWQKSYICIGLFRRMGKTTAKCIKRLIEHEAGPIDFIRPPYSIEENFERKELFKMAQKFDKAGIDHNPICFTQKDYKEATEQMKKLYLCDDTKNDKCRKTWCAWTGTGECRLTTHEEYALGGQHGTDERR